MNEPFRNASHKRDDYLAIRSSLAVIPYIGPFKTLKHLSMN